MATIRDHDLKILTLAPAFCDALCSRHCLHTVELPADRGVKPMTLYQRDPYGAGESLHCISVLALINDTAQSVVWQTRPTVSARCIVSGGPWQIVSACDESVVADGPTQTQAWLNAVAATAKERR